MQYFNLKLRRIDIFIASGAIYVFYGKIFHPDGVQQNERIIFYKFFALSGLGTYMFYSK